MMMELFLSALISLFVIADPLGTAAVFAAMTKDMNDEETNKTALKACLISASLLILFGIAGKYILIHTGISLPAFRIAGGFLLFVTAFRMIMGAHDRDSLESDDSAYRDRTEIAVFPLSIPLLAGPGCMTATLLLMTASPALSGKFIVIGAIVLVQLTAWFCMRGARKLVTLFGHTGTSILSRVMGVILAALSVQFVVDGVISIWQDMS